MTDDSTVYVLDESRNLRYQLAGSLQWTTLATAVRSLFVKAPDQTIFAVLENGQVLQWRSRATPCRFGYRCKATLNGPEWKSVRLKGQQLKRYQRDGSAVVLDRDVRSFAMNSDGVGYVLNSRGLLASFRVDRHGPLWTVA